MDNRAHNTIADFLVAAAVLGRSSLCRPWAVVHTNAVDTNLISWPLDVRVGPPNQNRALFRQLLSSPVPRP